MYGWDVSLRHLICFKSSLQMCECVTHAALDPNAKGEFGLLFFMFSQVRRGPPRTHHTVSKDGSAPRPVGTTHKSAEYSLSRVAP